MVATVGGARPLDSRNWLLLSLGSLHAAATLATAIIGIALTWLTGWRRGVALTLAPLWAIGVIYSRVLLGVHSPVDVVVGSIIGVAFGFGVLRVFRTCVEYFCVA